MQLRKIADKFVNMFRQDKKSLRIFKTKDSRRKRYEGDNGIRDRIVWGTIVNL